MKNNTNEYKEKIYWTAKGIVDYLNEEIVLGRIVEEFGEVPEMYDREGWEKFNAIFKDVMKSIKNQIN